MIFIDANVFLAYDNVDDSHHVRAAQILQEIESGAYGQQFTSDYVFNEVVGVALRKLGKERAVILGEQILKSTFILNIDNQVLSASWRMFARTAYKLSLVDCTNVMVAKIARA